ncbi:TIGR03773 family transporter-associated surface protein [Arcanobacterium canis]
MKLKALKAAATAAVASFALMSITPVTASATEGNVFSRDHTDGFSIVTVSGVPTIQVKNGLRNNTYNGNATFVIDKTAYIDDPNSGLDEEDKPNFEVFAQTGHKAYYTTSQSEYFSPGWSGVPSSNGFTANGVLFSDVKGPGEFSIYGNHPTDETKIMPVLAGDQYFVKNGSYLPVFGHTHGSWYFQHAGKYTFTATPLGVKDGKVIKGTPVTQTYEVTKSDADKSQTFEVKSLGDDPTAKDRPEGVRAEDLGGKTTTVKDPEKTTESDNKDEDSDDDTSSKTDEDDTKTSVDDEDSDDTSATDEDEDEDDEDADDSDKESSESTEVQEESWEPLSNPVDLTGGHLDAFYIYAFGPKRIDLLTKEDITDRNVVRTPESARFIMEADTYQTGLGYNLPGGETAGYISPSTKARNGLYPGFASNRYTKNGLKNAKVVFESITGPGKLAFIDNSGFDPVALKALPAPFLDNKKYYVEDGATYSVPPSFHKHLHWVFTKPGKYVIKVKAVADSTHGKIESAVKTYNWFVKPNPADPHKDAAGDLSELDKKVQPNPENTTPSDKGSIPWTKLLPADNTSGNGDHDSHPAAKKLELSSGHIDLFNVVAQGKKLILNAKDDTTGGQPVLRAPESFFLRVSDKSKQNIPDGLARKTAPQGYLLSSSGDDQTYAPFAGWDTSLVQPQFGPISINFNKVTTPKNGKVFMFHPSANGKIISPLVDGNMELNSGDAILQKTPMHVHTSWLFTVPGVYTMTVQASDAKGALAAGALMGLPKADSVRIVSNEATYTWLIGDETPQPKATDGSLTNPGQPSDSDKPAEKNDAAKQNEHKKPAAPQAGQVTVFDHGHFDLFNVVAKDGKITLSAKEDTKGKPQLHKPESIALRVKDDRQINTPNTFPSTLPKQGFFLPANGADTKKMVWPGWDTGAVRPDFEATKIVFDKVEGPGGAFLFLSGPFGDAKPALKSGNFNLSNGDYINQATPAHVHANWMFETPGIYRFTVHAESTPKKGGAAVKSNTGVYTFIVGDSTKLPNETKALAGKTASGKKKTGNEHDNSADNNQHTSNHGQSGKSGDDNTGVSNSGASFAPAASGASTREACLFVPDKSARTVAAAQPAAGKAGMNIVPLVKDDRSVPAKWVSPTSLTFGIGNAGKTSTPQSIGGIPKNTTVWMISSAQVNGVPWVGMNTQHPTALENIKGSTSISLTSFSGPGMMEVYTSGSQLGQIVGDLWFSGNGNRGGGTATIPANTHVHPNWMFSKPGIYKVGLTMSATTKDGKRITGSTTLTFNVGGTGNANSGHFDFGPQVLSGAQATTANAAQSVPQGKWQTASGKPCTPTSSELKAAGFPSNLSHTGASGVAEALALMLMALAVGGTLVVSRKRA